ncbi:hypothetical protein CVT24_012177 [Panaeolus cyanescens]|uniref:Uncharacterized protein n=1 Tax=Panaeolus cyanescens TaxID=181874 RepID=A0A409X5R8_9AGAR|nr:hypothetical protein CVT24_012177 [Panaeolus cyanescens]
MASSAPSQPSQIPSLTPAPQGWIYTGCYEDTQLRILDGGFRGSDDTTVISCISAQSRPAPSSPTTTVPNTAPPPPPSSSSTSDPSSTTITSTSSSTGTRPSLTRTGSETTSLTTTSDTLSNPSTSLTNLSASTPVIPPPPIDQIFTPDNNHSPSSLSSAAVAGIAITATAITAILIVLLILLIRKRRREMRRITMTQHATTPAAYTNTPTYQDIHPEGLPAYDDLETSAEGTAIPAISGPVVETKARLQPCRPPVPIEASTDDSLSYLSAGAGDTNRVKRLS